MNISPKKSLGGGDGPLPPILHAYAYKYHTMHIKHHLFINSNFNLKGWATLINRSRFLFILMFLYLYIFLYSSIVIAPMWVWEGGADCNVGVSAPDDDTNYTSYSHTDRQAGGVRQRRYKIMGLKKIQ